MQEWITYSITMVADGPAAQVAVMRYIVGGRIGVFARRRLRSRGGRANDE
jgi:hypothetical protein